MSDWDIISAKLNELAKAPFSQPRVKGPGYFGRLNRPGGGYSTELSVRVNGEEIPALVPILSKDEINHLLGGGVPTNVIIDKAVTYSRERKKQGKTPFAQRGELEWPVPR